MYGRTGITYLLLLIEQRGQLASNFNLGSMGNIYNKHLKLEQETWLRTLDYIQEENVFLKNHLADVIKNDIAHGILEESEYFQGLFVDKDRLLVLIRYDIARQGRCLDADRLANSEEDCIKRQDRLRVDMRKLEEEFSGLKTRFSTFMAKNM